MSIPSLEKWAPFQIDALGLVTIFGHEEMDVTTGNLVQSWVTEWLPILGSYIVASNKITAPKPGFILYNITDGIVATDVAAWFTRWLTSYPLTYTATTITLRMDGKPMPLPRRAISIILAVLTISPLVIFTIFMRDGWGIANFASMIVSTLTRKLMVNELRSSVDKAIEDLMTNPGEDVKVFLTLPDGKAVTIRGPRSIVVNCVLTEPQPRKPRIYFFLRGLGWLAFGVHALALGMSSLFHQILSVVILLMGTVMKSMHVGDLPSTIGSRLRLDVDLGDGTWFRSRAYARLDLTPTEEDCMVHWNLFPQRNNVFWWTRYRTVHLSWFLSTKKQESKPREQDTESRTLRS